MKIGLWKKGLVLGIILLFVGVSVLPASGDIFLEKTSIPSIPNKKIIYVGGSGPNNYSTIKEGIFAAGWYDGDTVFVYDDSSPYNENIWIGKWLNLIGEDMNTTIIDGHNLGNDVIKISSFYPVKISGFTIQNSFELHAGINLASSYEMITISGNIIKNNDWGIYCSSSSNSCTISGNIIRNNYENGICLDYNSDNITISHNNISNNDIGILLDDSESNTILDNNISKNHGGGIYLRDSTGNSITGNNINNNIIYNCLILEGSSNNNIIYHNNFINNDHSANDECNNIWDDGKYGNYWSDYEDKYPDAKPKLFKPWMWDTPYEIEGGDDKDNCPLINQWSNSKPRPITRNKPFNFNFNVLEWLSERFLFLERLLSLIKMI